MRDRVAKSEIVRRGTASVWPVSCGALAGLRNGTEAETGVRALGARQAGCGDVAPVVARPTAYLFDDMSSTRA
jgi:hypothetical protein